MSLFSLTPNEIIYHYYKESNTFIVYNKSINSITPITNQSPPPKESPPLRIALREDIKFNDTITINTSDKDINISINKFSTVFSVSLIINDILITIYKKIYHNKNNLINSITTNYIKHKSKAIDSICKMAEFVYKNKDFIENLVKIKQIIICEILWKNNPRILDFRNNKIYINVNELSKLKIFKQLSEQNSSEYINVYNLKKNQIYNPVPTFFNSKITNITNSSKVQSSFITIESLINKQNFDIVKPLNIIHDINPNLLNDKYITNSSNGFLIADIYYNRLYNNNKRLNYYYGQPFTNKEIIIFNQNPKEDIYSKITYHNRSIHGFTIIKNKFLITFSHYKDNIRLLTKTQINENNQSQQLENLKGLKISMDQLENMFNDLNKNTSFVIFIQYMFASKKFKLSRSSTGVENGDNIFNKSPIFITDKNVKTLSKAIENIEFNIKTNNIGFKYIDSILDPLIKSNSLLFTKFIKNIFIHTGVIVPSRFFKMKNINIHETKYIVLTEVFDLEVTPNKEVVDKPRSPINYNQTLYELMILMNRKYTEDEIQKIKEQWTLIQLKSI